MKKNTIQAIFFLVSGLAAIGFITTQRMVLHANSGQTTTLAPEIKQIVDKVVGEIIYEHFREPNARRLTSIPFKNIYEFKNYLDRLRPEEGKSFGPPGSDQTFLEIFEEHMTNIERRVGETLDKDITRYIKDIDEVRPQIIKGIAAKELAPFFDQVDPIIR